MIGLVCVSGIENTVGLFFYENNGLSGANSGEFRRGYSYDNFGRSVAVATVLEGTTYTSARPMTNMGLLQKTENKAR